MDDFIVPGRKQGGVREIVDVPGTGAPIIKIAAGDLVVVDHGKSGLNFLVPGNYIIVPLEKWVSLLNRAVGKTMAEEADEGEKVSRQVRRALRQDRQN